MVTAAMKLKDAYSLEGVMTNLDSIFKSRIFPAQGLNPGLLHCLMLGGIGGRREGDDRG